VLAVEADVVIIGGGAAGLMCAIEAGRRGRRTLVVEHAEQVGKKVLISGGGRCNFTNLHAVPEVYLSENPRFAISALTRYTSADFIGMVERHGIAYHEKKLGQLFCDGASKQIVDMLLSECAEAGVEVRVATAVESVAREDGAFRLAMAGGEVECGSLVVATGGLSVPKMGATGFAYDVARKFGVRVTETRPGLVPFTFRKPALDFHAGLAGVSADASVTCNGVTWRESLLFTHRGLSGPSILQVSSHWHEGNDVIIDLAPDIEDLAGHLAGERVRQPNADLAWVVGSLAPRRLAQALCGAMGARRMQSLSNRELADFAPRLKRWTVRPDGTEGYRTAEVTVGGIDTRDLSSQTMEARGVPGLYFVGEAVDVTGPLGGYNFQWAWASGYCAGQAV